MALPIHTLEHDFINAIGHHNVVVHAPTGSGKSTCLPLWAAQSNRVLVIQPRRIAATSLAQYLAQQKHQQVGEEIGYAIRFEAHLSDATRVVFATPGVALRWFFENGLTDYKVVMLDEFHERRWDTDLLLALLKRANKHRLIVTSATLANSNLEHYIDAHTLHSQGSMFDIESRYLCADMQAMPSRHDLALRVYDACKLALSDTHADILVFLPGRGEIQECINHCKTLPARCIALHGSSPIHEQQAAMHLSEQRRIIFATNVAETSLTVPGIECVIDSGLERRTHLRKGKTVLGLDAIAKDSQKQRKGRCGRTAPGVYIALFGEHAPLMAHTPVEIEREALDELVLASACAQVSIDDLDLLTAPPQSSLNRAKQTLLALGAIDDKCLATELGRKIYPLPVDAQLGYLIESMPNSTLRQAMIDLASVIMTPAQLYAMPNSETRELLGETLGEQYQSSDIAMSIAALRLWCEDTLDIDETALTEAQTYSNYLRHHYQLPELAKSARFDYEALLEAIAYAFPQAIFVRKDNRRGGFGNGELEVRPAKNSLLNEQADAAVVLSTFSLAGKGKKHADTLATLCAPISIHMVRKCAPCNEQITAFYICNDTQCDDLSIRAKVTYTYAGRELATDDIAIDEGHTIEAVVSLILAGSLFPSLATQVNQSLAYHALYLDYHNKTQHLPTAYEHLQSQLRVLGVQNQEDLALIDDEDLFYHGIDEWEAHDFVERFPLQVELPSMTLKIEYHFRAKRVVAHYHSGDRKDPPKRWELPNWSGLQIRYKKASKVVDIR
ncbi:DEAD/DEAH box helicase [Pseudoalteromonas sp. SSDWG2]|uniref:DEAD/DEAH box helicase n=1 Tax=Pseudoalteromonas sp. SSDWG2 TaxID=3139391 RepID=UPI003BAA1F2C